MTMQFDAKASQPRTSSGVMTDQNGSNLTRTRIKSVYGVSGASAGTVIFYDGSSASGEVLATINTPAAANAGTYWVPIPGEGILAASGVYVAVTNAATVMVMYG